MVLASGLSASTPENLSYPLASLTGAVTPPDRFFVRDHFSPPEVSLQSWRLSIEGRVQSPFELSFSDLVEHPAGTIEAVLECAGNVAGGSAVSNGVWEGVPLASLLERARPEAGAAFVLLEGADTGRLFETGQPFPYSQLLPLEKCLDRSSLVAFKLNNLALPARNGFPARALFPGWYGMDSVKWLRRIAVIGADERDTNFERSGINRLYNRVSRANGSDQITRLSAVQVKSAIAWPANAFKVPSGRYTIWGFAWSGAERIRGVAVTTDGGKSWQPATLGAQANRYTWVKWSYAWDAAAGDHVLMSRASDASGNEQPLRRNPARKDSYELNWCEPLHGSVR